MKGILIKTTATCRADLEVIDFSAPLHKSISEKALSGGHMEIVRPKRLPDGYCMIVDEEGRLKGLPQNKAGSFVYGTDEHGEPIVGDLVIMAEGIVDDEPCILGVDEDRIERLMDAMANALGEQHVLIRFEAHGRMCTTEVVGRADHVIEGMRELISDYAKKAGVSTISVLKAIEKNVCLHELMESIASGSADSAIITANTPEEAAEKVKAAIEKAIDQHADRESVDRVLKNALEEMWGGTQNEEK